MRKSLISKIVVVIWLMLATVQVATAGINYPGHEQDITIFDSSLAIVDWSQVRSHQYLWSPDWKDRDFKYWGEMTLSGEVAQQSRKIKIYRFDGVSAVVYAETNAVLLSTEHRATQEELDALFYLGSIPIKTVFFCKEKTAWYEDFSQGSWDIGKNPYFAITYVNLTKKSLGLEYLSHDKNLVLDYYNQGGKLIYYSLDGFITWGQVWAQGEEIHLNAEPKLGEVGIFWNDQTEEFSLFYPKVPLSLTVSGNTVTGLPAGTFASNGTLNDTSWTGTLPVIFSIMEGEIAVDVAFVATFGHVTFGNRFQERVTEGVTDPQPTGNYAVTLENASVSQGGMVNFTVLKGGQPVTRNIYVVRSFDGIKYGPWNDIAGLYQTNWTSASGGTLKVYVVNELIATKTITVSGSVDPQPTGNYTVTLENASVSQGGMVNFTVLKGGQPVTRNIYVVRSFDGIKYGPWNSVEGFYETDWTSASSGTLKVYVVNDLIATKTITVSGSVDPQPTGNYTVNLESASVAQGNMVKFTVLKNGKPVTGNIYVVRSFDGIKYGPWNSVEGFYETDWTSASSGTLKVYVVNDLIATKTITIK